MELRDHIYNVPDTYVGSVMHSPRQDWIMVKESDSDEYTLQLHEHTMPKAVMRIFLETISNAGDAIQKSRELKISSTSINVTMDNQWVTVVNDGAPVPIAPSKDFPDKLVPDVIFGELLTSSHYDPSAIKLSAGKNGYGIKVVSIFSTEFIVEIYDHFNHLHYVRKWTDGMKVKNLRLDSKKKDDPTEPYHGKTSSVSIKYRLNFPRFDMVEYTPEIIGLFRRITLDYSMSCHVKTSFNGTVFDETIDTMATRYFPEITGNVLKFDGPCEVTLPGQRKKGTVASPENSPVKKSKKQKSYDDPDIPWIEFRLLETPYEHHAYGFVNGLMTNEGVHIESIYDAIAEYILPSVNTEFAGKKILNISDIKRHVSVIVNCRLPNPAFDSQSKEKLTTPIPHIVTDKKWIEPILTSWELPNLLKRLVDEKQDRALTKTDGKKTRHVVVPGLEDANEAGGTKSHLCECWIVEGKSAKGAAISARDNIPNGSDYIGIFPIRGKMRNVRGVSKENILKNVEIANLKKVFGLCEGVDYKDEANRKKLRYAKWFFFTDQDLDGSHIKALGVNFLDTCYPSLLMIPGFSGFIKTPIVRVWKGGKNRHQSKQSAKFYTAAEYAEWRSKTPDWQKWEFKYFKGLATSDKLDMKDEFGSGKVNYTYFSQDEESKKTLAMIFGKSTHEKKEWLSHWDAELRLPDIQTIPINEFINKELIHFAMANVQRSIARYTDGLKESLRKILAGTLKKWKKPEKDVTVEMLAGYVAEHYNYHYGPTSLQGAITKMAQNFIGANNLNYFEPRGEFGTRNEGGEDAGSARYISVYPEEWLRTVFKDDDDPLLEYITEGDKSFEPKTFLPIFPMWAINGTQGIATAFSSTFPNYDPKVICQWIKARLDGSPLPEVKPWYKGFKGKLSIKYNNKERKTHQDPTPKTIVDHFKPAKGKKSPTREEEEETDDVDDNVVDFNRVTMSDDEEAACEVSLITEGKYTAELHKGIRITELPIGMWIANYRIELDKMIENKQVTKVKYYNNVNDDSINMFVTGFSNPNIKALKLRTSIGLTNMVLLDENDKPLKLANVNEWLEKFFVWRFPFYEKRKIHQLKAMQEQINQWNEKMKFIQAVVSGKLIVLNTKEELIQQRCKELKLDPSFLDSINLRHVTQEKIDHTAAQIASMQATYAALEAKSPSDIWKADLDEFLVVYKKTILKR